MSFDQGIDFRSTATYVTDPENCTDDIYASAYGVGNYPVTTPQGNTVGWESGTFSLDNRNRSASIDARLAGCVFTEDAAYCSYRFDLPAAGDYNVTLAAGDDGSAAPAAVALWDTSTVLATLCNGTAATGSFFDALGSEWTAAEWPSSNQPYAATFATTICRFINNPNAASGNHFIAHARVTAAGGGGISVDLTGQSVASTEGALASSLVFAASGQALTSTLGTISAAVSSGLTGQSLASSEGALGAALTLGAQGQALTSTEGEISAGSAGNVTRDLAGQSIESGAGGLGAALGCALGGAVVASTQGALGFGVSYGLTAEPVISSTQGALSASWSASVGLAGQAVQSHLGIPLLAVAPSLAGQSLASAYGSMSVSLSAELDGQTILSVEGTITASGGSVPLTVPDVGGWTFARAYFALIAQGFEVAPPAQSMPIARVPPGTVVGQSPPAGSASSKGASVTLTVNGTPPVWPSLQ